MIHQFQLGGYNIVLDVCSGSVHAVDEIAYEIIARFEGADREAVIDAVAEKFSGRGDVTRADVEECYDQVCALRDGGKLFTSDSFEPMAGALKARTSGVIKALCLHVAHTCNLNCAYCFASQGKYHGDRAVMSFEVGKRALDFLIEHSGSRRNLEVDFFGGEPLMNFDVVKQLVAYARSIEKEKGKNFRFTLTTNGMLIDDDVIDFANREMSNVVLSLDGRKEIHDRYRVDYAGNGSWEKVVPKFQKLVEAREGKNYYMRGTFTHANPDFLNDIRQMLDLGFTELSMEPVVCAPRRSRGADPGGSARGAEAVRGAGRADAQSRPRGQALHLLPLHDRPHRRPLHLQAHLRLRLRHRVHGRHPLGRPLPLPPVRGRGEVQAGRHLGWRDQHGDSG